MASAEAAIGFSVGSDYCEGIVRLFNLGPAMDTIAIAAVALFAAAHCVDVGWRYTSGWIRY